MGDNRLRIVFAGGGTGGHLFPAIAIADEIRKATTNAEITFIGTRAKIESRVVPEHGYAFESIWVSGFRRKLTPENILFPVKFVVALVQSFILMRRLRPNVVVGTGGYVCGPPLFIASLLDIPTLIQEQNSYPGATTRLLASRVDKVYVSFKRTLRFLKRTDNVTISGNPTRASVGTVKREQGAAFFSLSPSKRTLLVFGGSLGASSINNAMVRILPKLLGKGIQIVWQTGETDFKSIVDAVELQTLSEMVKVHRFIDRIECGYAACDLAVCRAGATTVAELTRAGVPSILVPYPYAAADHQTENARAMVDGGAAVMIRDDELDEKLFRMIDALFTDLTHLHTMGKNALAIGNPAAATVLANAVLGLAK